MFDSVHVVRYVIKLSKMNLNFTLDHMNANVFFVYISKKKSYKPCELNKLENGCFIFAAASLSHLLMAFYDIKHDRSLDNYYHVLSCLASASSKVPISLSGQKGFSFAKSPAVEIRFTITIQAR